jgi:formylglycine-generating enzyme required for sulfatase activity
MLVLTVPLRRLLRRRGFKLSDKAFAAASVGYGALVGGTTGSGIVLLSLLMAAGLEGGAVIGTDALASIVISIAKIAVFGLAGVLGPQTIAIALLIGLIALPGSYLAKLMVERLPLHVHGAILDAVVIMGGATMIIGALLASAPAHAQERKEDRKDREFQECADCPEMIGIPAGEFTMGSPPGELGRFDNEGPQHTVAVAAFALGKYDITSQQFLGFLKETGSQPAPCDQVLGLGWRIPRKGLAYAPSLDEPRKWPAVCLDWRDAEAYIAWLNARARRAHPDAAPAGDRYRLPSEAEWEYAARAGTKTARPWGDAIGHDKANCNGCGSPWDNRLLADVDSFAPNPFGLYGILGNAWQWTLDCWHPNYGRAPRDGRAWTEPNCARHVIRGGAWNNVPAFIRSAARSSSIRNGGPYDYSSLTGFRIVRDLP